jgi:quinol monooxygenase YgiN
MTTEQPLSPPVVAASTLQAKKGRRDELIALLTELARQIHAEPGGTHYSVHRPLGDDPDGPLLVIQACASVEAFREHSAKIRGELPRLVALLEGPPSPPVLFQPVPLGGPAAKESLGRGDMPRA